MQQASTQDQTEGTHAVAVTLTAQGKEPTHGEARILELDAGARAKRARRGAGICVAIGVGSLAIPIVHFVLPWLMMIIAAVVYRRIAGQGAELTAASGPCPACGAVVSLPRQALEWPIEWNCESCRKRLVIEQAPD
ncbi:MAG: hypothetical protein RIT45_4150 [Pseudomonadota bacterium]|jgi:hypothetical protein